MYTFVNNPAALNALLFAQGIGNNPSQGIQTEDMVRDPATGEMISRNEYLRRHGTFPSNTPQPTPRSPSPSMMGGGSSRLALPLRSPFGQGASFQPMSQRANSFDSFVNPTGRQRYNRSGT